MSETKELLEKLDLKVSHLLSKLKETNEELNTKNQEIEHLKSQLIAKNDVVTRLEKENVELKSTEPSENQEELKFKIGEMVKEIDRCISLLKV